MVGIRPQSAYLNCASCWVSDLLPNVGSFSLCPQRLEMKSPFLFGPDRVNLVFQLTIMPLTVIIVLKHYNCV